MGVIMEDNPIRIKVTQETFDKTISIDDWMNFIDLTQKEQYQLMLQFVVDENDNPVGIDEARKLFKTVKKEEWFEYLGQFMKAVKDAFVSPTSGDS